MSARKIIAFLNRALSARLCEVCGAEVTNINPKARTCGDDVCLRAYREGRSRDEIFAEEATGSGKIPICFEDTVLEDKRIAAEHLRRMDSIWLDRLII